jgi:hypothetical protein
MATLTGRTLKVSTLLDPKEILAVSLPEGVPRCILYIHFEDRGLALTADVAAKAVRKAKAVIAEHGIDNVTALLQGKLAGLAIAEAGLVVNAKVPKIEPEERLAA